jgi:hypothetical protein
VKSTEDQWVERFSKGDIGTGSAVGVGGGVKNVRENGKAGLTGRFGIAMDAAMTATMTRRTRWCWRTDLAGFLGLTDGEKAGFLLVLEWFEN